MDFQSEKFYLEYAKNCFVCKHETVQHVNIQQFLPNCQLSIYQKIYLLVLLESTTQYSYMFPIFSMELNCIKLVFFVYLSVDPKYIFRVPSCSSSACICASSRFFSQSGVPCRILRDNASYLVTDETQTSK